MGEIIPRIGSLLKVLFAIKALDDINGGAERVLVDVASGLAELSHNISVVSFDAEGGTPFYPLHKKIKQFSLAIGLPKEKATILENIYRMAAIRKLVRAQKPDVVVAFMHSMFVPLSFALIGTGTKIIASEHTVPAHYKNKSLEFFLLILSSFFVQKITILSESIKKSYPRFFQKKMVTIHNPVITPTGIADTVGNGVGRKIILSVGRLDPMKDHKTLISAFAALTAKYSNWDLRIIGEGEMRHNLKIQIKSLGMQKRIFMPGATKNISAEYKKAQIFALPSRYESFGLATAEAMAHGLPAIGFLDCPGTNELIYHQENGLLVSGNDRVKDLKNALELLIQYPEKRTIYGIKAQKSVKKYSYKCIISEWEEMLFSCLNKIP